MKRRLPEQEAPQGGGRLLAWSLPGLVLALSLVLTLSLWARERRELEGALSQALQERLHEARRELEHRVQARALRLEGLSALLQSAPGTEDIARVRRFVQALRLPGAEAVPLALLHRGPSGGWADATATLLLEAGTGSSQGWDAQARAALQQAAEGAGARLSPPLDWAPLGQAGHRGALLLLPVRSGPEASARAADVLLAAPVHLTALLDQLQRVRGLRLQLRPADAPASAGASIPVWSASEALRLAGQDWLLEAQAEDDFVPLQARQDLHWILVLGLLASGLLTALSWGIGAARRRTRALDERMSRALKEAEQRWAFALEGAGDGVWEWRPDRAQLITTARWKALMCWPLDQQEPTLAQLVERAHPDDAEALHRALHQCLEGRQEGFAMEHRVRDRAGEWRWMLARGRVAERDGREHPRRLIGTLSDVHQRRLSEEKMRFLARHDPLTELANRAHFEERLHQALLHARRYKEELGLILLDLDRFKPVNDEHGHAVGDQLLQTVARRLRAAVRETDVVGRVGGDEFVVLLGGPLNSETAQKVVDKIYNQLSQPMEFAGLRLEITCSVGLALYPRDGQDGQSLYKAADDAMYANKRARQRAIGAGSVKGGAGR